jgi:hypothetical protein
MRLQAPHYEIHIAPTGQADTQTELFDDYRTKYGLSGSVVSPIGRST